MIFPATFALLTTPILARSSLKASTAQHTLNPRQDNTTIGGFTICTGTNFTGECWTGVTPTYTCMVMGPFAYNFLSFLPNEGTTCYLMNKSCNGVYTNGWTTMTHSSPTASDTGETRRNSREYLCFPDDGEVPDVTYYRDLEYEGAPRFANPVPPREGDPGVQGPDTVDQGDPVDPEDIGLPADGASQEGQ